MANSNKVDSNTIFKALDVIINKRIEDLDLDKTVVATIEKPLYPARDGSHRVKYNTGVFTAYAPVGTVYAPNTTVYVLIPQGDFSKKKNILGTASSYYIGNTTQAVSSALNDYSVVGSNTLTLIDEDFRANGVGLNSYTLDSDGDNYQDIVVLYDRKNIVDSYYKLNIPQLETYIKEAKAVMLSADFRTCLDEVQQTQPGAEYGLIFSLIFNNQNTIYSTNGELFNSVSENVKSYQGDHLISMSRLQESIETTLNNSELDVSSIIAEINDNIYPTMLKFLGANAGSFTAQETAIFTAYKNLIINLLIGNFETINSLKEEYYNWFDESLATVQTDINQPTKTLSYVLSSSSMSGNPFLFTGFSNQYEIFPIDKENFIGIDNIIFYCKGFQQNDEKWQYIDKIKPKMQERNGEYHGKDIWVKNVQFLALKEISSEYGDYRISVTTPNGAIFYGVTDEDKVTAAAKVRYKEWTSVNDSCTFYWFKKDIRVSSTQHPNYDMRGGLGWYHLGTTSTGHESTRTFVGSDNMAYENFYLCVAEYNDGNGPIYLKEYFTLYNEACKRNITIESDIGTKFKFDNGVPTLTCLIDGRSSYFDTDIVIEDNSEENDSGENDPEVVVPENKDDLFKFYWSKRNTSGLVVNFIEGNEEPGVSVDKNILSYPIKNVQNASQVFFECQVYKVDDAHDIEHSEKWYCIGTGSITLYNEDTKTINEFTVKIDNDTQVFQYSETGVSPLFATTITPTNFRHTEPIEILPLRAHLYDPTGLEVSEGRYTVSWRFPIQNTLITPPADLYENVLTEEFDQIDGQTTEFSIAQYYDYNCTNNQIQCIVNFGGEAYSAYTDFYFGKIGDNGTNGTDYVAKITITDENDHTHSLDTQPLTVYEYIENEEKRAVWNSHYLQNSDDPILEVQLYNRGTLVSPSDYTFVRWDILGGIGRSKYWTFEEVTEEQDGQTYTLQHKIKLHYNPDKNGTYINQLVKATILFKNREYHCVYPVCIVQINGSINDLESELYPDETGKNLLYIDNSKYLKQILYNSDGRTPMYNKNQGVFIHGLQGRATTWQIAGGLGSQDISDIPIRLLEEKDSITGVSELSTTNVDGIYILPSDEYNGISCDNRVEITSYSSEQFMDWITEEMPGKIQAAKEEYGQKVKEIKESVRQENINYRNINIGYQRQYEDKIYQAHQLYDRDLSALGTELGNIDSWYNEVQGKAAEHHNEIIGSKDEELQGITAEYNNKIAKIQNDYNGEENESPIKNIKILVPIYMSLNVYGLASLNAWDGNSIDINEHDGYIIAPQIGAGAKDKDDQGHELNTFTGIVMGEMSAYGEEDSDIGLLGLSQGRQSIFLDAKTGNAYFGLPETNKFGGSGEEGYTEGRIELKPGDVSTIGGWHLGRRSLFYAQNAALDPDTVVTINGKNYGVGDVLPDLGPGNIDEGKNSTTHEKDIGHTDSGILLAANNLQNGELNNKPYISLKGKPLTVGTGSSFDIDDTTGNNVLLNGDSLELQLDPNQSSLFTIYRHYKDKNDEWTRYPMVGINSEGRFYSNALQDQETSLSLNYVGGFGWTAAQQKYIGLNITASQKTIFKAILDTQAFSENAKEKDYPLRITGSNGSNEYNRPISLHGRNINLYAVTRDTNYPQIPDPEHPNDSKWNHADVPLSTKSKISISEDLGFIGTDAIYEEVEPSSFINENTWYELNWIYELTEDTEVVNNKTYYSLENEEYIEVTEIAESANPQEENWYEKVANYIETQDSEFNLEKDYYYNDNGEYKIVYNNFIVPYNWFVYNESDDVYSRAGGTALAKTMYYIKSGGHYLNILTNNIEDTDNNVYTEFKVTGNNVDFDFGKKHRVKVGGTYNFSSGGNWTTNIHGAANFNATETITSTSQSAQNIYANHNNSSFASLLEMGSTQVALGYSNLLNNEKSHIILTPTNGSAWYSRGIMSVDVNGKININQENANEGINIVSANGDAEGTEKGRVYLTIRPNSGVTKNLNDSLSTHPNAPYQQISNVPENANPKELDWYQYINGQYVKTEDEVVTEGHVYFTNWNDFPQFNLTTNDNAFIRHQWCINPNQSTIQDSAGWVIKPGIQTNWLKISDDSHKLFFNWHSISVTRNNEWGYGDCSTTITISGDNLYTLLNQIADKLAYLENYCIWADKHGIADAKSAAAAAQSTANAAQSTANNKVDWSTYNSHYHWYYDNDSPAIPKNTTTPISV